MASAKPSNVDNTPCMDMPGLPCLFANLVGRDRERLRINAHQLLIGSHLAGGSGAAPMTPEAAMPS